MFALHSKAVQNLAAAVGSVHSAKPSLICCKKLFFSSHSLLRRVREAAAASKYDPAQEVSASTLATWQETVVTKRGGGAYTSGPRPHYVRTTRPSLWGPTDWTSPLTSFPCTMWYQRILSRPGPLVAAWSLVVRGRTFITLQEKRPVWTYFSKVIKVQW